jgi:hypothetical protein
MGPGSSAGTTERVCSISNTEKARGGIRASWFETALTRLLTMRI